MRRLQWPYLPLAGPAREALTPAAAGTSRRARHGAEAHAPRVSGRRAADRAAASRAPYQPDDEYLVALAKQGASHATDRLVRRYHGFVRLKASSYFLIGGESDDLIQEGLVGLYKAIRDYRPERESSFRNFAELCITRQIITAVKTATRNKHTPLNSYVSFSQTPAAGGEEGEPTMADVLPGSTVHDPVNQVISTEEIQSLVGCRPLRRARVLHLADRDELLALDQEPPVTGRIGRRKAEHDEVGFHERPPERLQRRRRDQRRVGVKHENVVGRRRERLPRREHGVAGPQPLRLHMDRRLRRRLADIGLDRARIRPDHHRHPVRARRPRRADHVPEHRVAGDLVHDLGRRGAHARPLARGKDDGKAVAFGHCVRRPSC